MTASDTDTSDLMAIPASIVGVVAGIVAGGFAARALARNAGVSGHIKDIGAMVMYIGAGAWILGVIGCYAALVLLRDSLALRTAGVVAVLLPLAGVLSWVIARGIGTSIGGAVGVAVAATVVVLVVGAVPLIARLLVRLVEFS